MPVFQPLLHALTALITGTLVLVVLSGVAHAQERQSAEVLVTARYDRALLESLDVEVLCGADTVARTRRALQPPAGELLAIPLPDGPQICAIRAQLPAGFSARYFAGADRSAPPSSGGCRFTELAPGARYVCAITVDQYPGRLTVYKKWIGASGKGDDVRIDLDCESGDYAGSRYINEGKPDGWEIRAIHHEGILCNVHEEVREDFRPDIIDCQGLLILPGREEECTMVNTKIVKRIETLNRYGKIVMVVLVLAVGLMAMRRMK